MKQLFTTAVLLFSATAFAQVGINNTSPKATLDITAKVTDGSKAEGLIIPQVAGNQIRTATASGIYGASQKGLIVYASSADSSPAGATVNITAPGYYYFDGSTWQRIAAGGSSLNTTLNSGNIYVGNASNVATSVAPTGDVTISNTGVTSIGSGKVTSSHIADGTVANADLNTGVGGIYKGNGSLSGNTTVTQAGNTLTFSPTVVNGFSVDSSTLSVDGANHRVGIGTNAPGNLLEINNSASGNTGLKLPTGAASGKTLVSDVDGNAIWQSSQISHYQTIIASSGGTFSFPMNPQQWTLYNKFDNVLADEIKTIYGASFGWDVTNQNFKVPKSGKYRVSVNVYFNAGTSGENWRAAIQLNNSSVNGAIPSMPFGSITVSNSDQISFFSGIVTLNAGDLLSLKVLNSSTTNPVKVFGGTSHTLLTIESL